MAAKAYILIETTVGKIRDVVAALKPMEGVKAADPVTGPYDVILVVETKDLDALAELVDRKIHGIPSVIRTITCVAI